MYLQQCQQSDWCRPKWRAGRSSSRKLHRCEARSRTWVRRTLCSTQSPPAPSSPRGRRRRPWHIWEWKWCQTKFVGLDTFSTESCKYFQLNLTSQDYLVRQRMRRWTAVIVSREKGFFFKYLQWKTNLENNPCSPPQRFERTAVDEAYPCFPCQGGAVHGQLPRYCQGGERKNPKSKNWDGL